MIPINKQFTQDLNTLYKKTLASLGEKDLKHLIFVVWRGRILFSLFMTTAFYAVNPFSILCMTLFLMNQWLLMHHIGHGGYDKVPGVPKKWTSEYYAMGARRFIDWFDWMYPPAWNFEHNYLHHYFTGEKTDPDRVHDNSKQIRSDKVPMIFRYLILLFFSLIWKFAYYAPNTLHCLQKKGKKENELANTNFEYEYKNIFNFKTKFSRELWLKCYLPYFSVHFIFFPSLFLIISKEAAGFYIINRLIAELLNNIYTFILIVPNHAGDDVYTFENHFTSKDEFYIRQVIGSVNYKTGNEVLDYFQMWLNYQIEHHLFPKLPMLAYRRIQPEVKAICKKHQIPYIEMNLFSRVIKLIEIYVGRKRPLILEEDHKIYSFGFSD